jgi:NADH-quinone oxidoreductase subunit H
VIRPGSLSLWNWVKGTLITGPIVVLAIWIVFRLNRGYSAAAPLGSDWPSVGVLRPGLRLGPSGRSSTG